jgi:hypothetical protein
MCILTPQQTHIKQKTSITYLFNNIRTNLLICFGGKLMRRPTGKTFEHKRKNRSQVQLAIENREAA